MEELSNDVVLTVEVVVEVTDEVLLERELVTLVTCCVDVVLADEVVLDCKLSVELDMTAV